MNQQSHCHRWLRFDLLARCAILVQASTTAGLGCFVPGSLTARLLAEGGAYGDVVLALFGGVVVLALLDLIINDVLPPCIVWRAIHKTRHKLYHFLAALYFVQAFAGVGSTVTIDDLLPLSYLAIGLVCAWYSWAITLQGGHA